MEMINKQEGTESGTMIRVVLFDWGGVLVDDPSPGIMAYVRERLGLGAEVQYEVPDEAMVAFQKGWISEQEFWQRITADLRLSANGLRPGLWREAFEGVYREKPEVFAWIDRLRAASIRTCALSNTEVPSVEMLHEKNYDCFDETIFSCECGWVKPEPEIFELARGKIGCEAGEIFFIDDKQANVDAARNAGFQAHCFRSSAGLFEAAAELGLPI